MARVFYVHGNKGEALDSIRKLRASGHVVRCHADCGPQAMAFLQDWKPDLLVVCLAKLPADGPHWTSMVKAAADFAGVPLVFAGGNAERTEQARAAFPAAAFSTFPAIDHHVSRLAAPAPSVAASIG
ncbi:MAG TPA: hypothetical protein VD971_11215 [Phycisphaerales bacterium]|nr:hypothetical protein [Phycisphaerales bacterium]